MMTIEDVSNMINYYLQNPTQENLYKLWVSMYITGDRIRSDKLFKELKDLIKIYAINFNEKFSFERKPLFRGVLLPPGYNMKKHNLWDYDHVSFTEDNEVAKAFSTIDSIYGIVFPKDYQGHIINYNIQDSNFIWFHYSWAEQMKDEVFLKFIKFWNQKEVIIGEI